MVGNELDVVVSGRFALDYIPVDVSRVAPSHDVSLLSWIIIAPYGSLQAVSASDAIQFESSLRLKKDSEILPRR